MSGQHYLDWNPEKPNGQGHLAIRYVDTEWSTPVEVTHWWPIGNYQVSPYRVGGLCWADLIGKPVRDGRDGVFSIDKITLTLVNGGKTLPVKTSRREIQPPKTRCETKYERGQWWKLLKSRGWVPA